MVELTDYEEFELDAVRGESGKKPKLAILNKNKLTRYELDNLMLNESFDVDVDA
jgi:hypothetical protein